ncbi:MAG: hypothetical protein IPO45_17025 [Saprospiraceae bacterium]|nr:hypothetical protein [Candidatus Brachybacter algidus]
MKKAFIKQHYLSDTSLPLAMFLDQTKVQLASGTCFIYRYEDEFFLITNWHNVTGLNPANMEPLSDHGGRPDVFRITMQKNEQPLSHLYVYRYLFLDNKATWFVHPEYAEKVDVVAIPIHFDENVRVSAINRFSFDNYELAIADDVFIVGFPYNLDGGAFFPIWKKGSVASEPTLPMDNLPKFLIDTASRSGMSGSPVIFKRPGPHIINNVLDDKTRLDTICGFAGVYSGRIQGKSALDAQLGIVWKKEVIEEIIEGKVLDSITF